MTPREKVYRDALLKIAGGFSSMLTETMVHVAQAALAAADAIPDAPLTDDIEARCEVAHDAYESAAKSAGWQTNPVSRVPWKDVPEPNKVAMRAALRAVDSLEPSSCSGCG